MKKICQSCGMEIRQSEDFGTNLDVTKNKEYCIHCYVKGKFTNNYTMKEQININLQYLNEFNKEKNTNFNEQQARKEMLNYFPTLKRWNCTCTEECASGYNPNYIEDL